MEVAQKSELEMDNFNRFKQDKLLNMEILQRNLRESRNEINAKDAIIDDLGKNKEEMRLSLKNYEEKIETELAKRDGVIRAKDREVHELHSLLEKS